jgi:hypothetical protein
MALTTDQVAQLLGRSRSAVTAMIGRNELDSGRRHPVDYGCAPSGLA